MEKGEDISEPTFGPILSLWFRVFVDAIETLKRFPASRIEHDFLFDEDNPVIDFIAEALGTTGDALRNRTRAGIERTSRARRHPGGASKLQEPGVS